MRDRAQPYRTDEWPRWTRRSAALSSALARAWFGAGAQAREGAGLGGRIEAVLGGAELVAGVPTVRAGAELARVYAGRPSIFALWSMPSSEHACAVAVDAPLARWIAARCLGASEQDAARSLAPAPWTAVMEGAFALACVETARTRCAPGPIPVFRAATDRWEDVAEALGAGEIALWPGFARAGSYTGGGALLCPMRAVRSTAERDPWWWSRARDLEIVCELICARESLAMGELEGLRAGELVVLGTALELGGPWGVAGPMRVRAGDVECDARIEGERVVCGGRLRAVRSEMETNHEAKDAETTDERTDVSDRRALLAGVRVEVEVVIARGAFTVGEVAAWRPGEVIALPSRVGSLVELRAGGRAVARGELCDVDGEVGVRVLELL